jgi:MoaA/NifB/PqqE/SkfB family radical SAM enzyme
MDNQIIIYGAGDQGRAARRILESQGFLLTAFADRDEVKVSCGNWEGAKVIGLDTLRELDKSTPIIIGIGAGRLSLLRQIDNMLTGWGFEKIFWSAVEFIEKLYPMKQLKPSFYGLEVCTNVGCSIKCKWCAQDLFVSRYVQRIIKQPTDLPNDYKMTLDTFKKCIDKIPPNISVDFSGYSETFLNPFAVDMILYAAKRGHDIILYTTLQGLTEKNVDRLKEVKFEHIMPHLPDMEGNSKIPVTEEYLKLLIKFWKLFNYAIGDNNNILAEGISYHGILHPKVVEILELNGINPLKYKNFSKKRLPIAGNINSIKNQKYNNNFMIQCGLTSYCNTKKVNKDDMKFFDEKLQTMPVLFPNGDVTLCNHDYGLTMVFGNLIKSNYYDLWKNNPFYDKIIDALKDASASVLCRTCEFAFDRNQLKLITRENSL